MSNVFGSSYASAYDAIYRDKSYESEIDAIEHGLARYANGIGQRVLDLGCGTGRHCQVLAERGRHVVGVERSPQMLQLAQERVVVQPDRMRFVRGDVRDVRVGERFDSVLMMFAVLGYQVSNEDVLAALGTARAHLDPGGALVFDVWWGPGVLRDPPGERARWFDDRGDHMLRTAMGHLDVATQTCTVGYRLLRLRGDRVVEDTREDHVMRYFFPREIELLLSTAGFELCRIGAFPDIVTDISDSTWNVSVIARAR